MSDMQGMFLREQIIDNALYLYPDAQKSFGSIGINMRPQDILHVVVSAEKFLSHESFMARLVCGPPASPQVLDEVLATEGGITAALNKLLQRLARKRGGQNADEGVVGRGGGHRPPVGPTTEELFGTGNPQGSHVFGLGNIGRGFHKPDPKISGTLWGTEPEGPRRVFNGPPGSGFGGLFDEDCPN